MTPIPKAGLRVEEDPSKVTADLGEDRVMEAGEATDFKK